MSEEWCPRGLRGRSRRVARRTTEERIPVKILLRSPWFRAGKKMLRTWKSAQLKSLPASRFISASTIQLQMSKDSQVISWTYCLTAQTHGPRDAVLTTTVYHNWVVCRRLFANLSSENTLRTRLIDISLAIP